MEKKTGELTEKQEKPADDETNNKLVMKKETIKSERQIELFAQIKKLISANQILVDVISELLGISDAAAYCRIRGTKLLNFEETVKLCNHFQISLDSVVGIASSKSVQCNIVPNNIKDLSNYRDFINDFASTLELISPDCEIILSATSIPMLNVLRCKELTFLNLFSWYKNACNFAGCYEDFLKLLDVDVSAKSFEKIMNCYRQIPSTEIWTENTIDSTLGLISYHSEMRHFKDCKFPLYICEQLLNLIDTMQSCAENGVKGQKDTPYKLYVSEIDIGNTFTLFKTPSKSYFLSKLFTVNGIIFSDENLCSEIENWLRTSIEQATLISGASKKARQLFFNNMRNKIQALVVKID